MRKLGEIVRLQVQVDSIKTSEKPNQRYTPDPHLTSVPVLRTVTGGVEGVLADGAVLADVHNSAHPRTKFTGQNGVSLGFTGHYDVMRDRFGAHLTTGIAGEAIVVGFDGMLPLETLANGIVIRGDDREVAFDGWQVLNPCAPFTRYCLQFPDGAKPNQEFAEALKFLGNGMRGFQTVYPDTAPPAEIHVGDIVYAID